ncbi:MAG: DUF1887 family CARF protein [Bacteroidales bacterium]|nr:DUF1887 family CARF protein [Bacteroidales bacterium]
MKHQITFVGGQLLPVYVGIKEFSPDTVHFIVSKESKDKLSLLKAFVTSISFTENICDPFDFLSIKQICEEVLSKIEVNDEVQFNLTGGTKIMVLAAQSIMQQKKINGFYINQDDTILFLQSYKIKELNCEISIKEFLELSGHKLSSSKALSDFDKDDFIAVKEIDSFSSINSKLYLQINSKIRSTYIALRKIPKNGQLEINKSSTLIWSTNEIIVLSSGKEIFKILSNNVRNLFFHAAWWELIVAQEISQWPKVKELLIQCELPFKSDNKTTKNEIDILINLGRKLIFIECKSGMVKQEDINKIKIVKDTYGGVISKSLLVCRFAPSQNILEKCKELSIGVFYCYDGSNLINPLCELVSSLDKLDKRLTI